MFTLTLETSNDAFGKHSAHAEIAWILGEARQLLLEGYGEHRLRDSNGNTVGGFTLDLDDE